MKFHCPYCKASFDSKGLPVKDVLCPSCKKQFLAKPDYEPKRIDNFKAETKEKAEEYLKIIRDTLSGVDDDGVRQRILYCLEEDILGKYGHMMRIKIGHKGRDSHFGCNTCSKCRKNVEEGLVVWLIDTFENTVTIILLCEECKNMGHLLEGEFNLLEDNLCFPLGYA